MSDIQYYIEDVIKNHETLTAISPVYVYIHNQYTSVESVIEQCLK